MKRIYINYKIAIHIDKPVNYANGVLLEGVFYLDLFNL